MPEHKMMSEFPPDENHRVTLGNWRKPPYNRWAFQHTRQLVPSTEIPNDPSNVQALDEQLSDIQSLKFLDGPDREMSVAAMLEETETDGFIVLHRGKVVSEYYNNGQEQATQHILMSVSKSVTGMLAGILVDKGLLAPDSPVTAYLPEAQDSVYGDATVRHILDMTVGIDFEEDYLASKGPFEKYRQASLWNPQDPTEPAMDLRSFLVSLQDRTGPHGKSFKYVSTNSDLLGWIIERAAGKRYADLLSDLIWKPMGAERDAYITNDAFGAPRSAGGICCTLRDLARFGLLIANDGIRDGKHILPESWIEDTRRGGVRSEWEAGVYSTSMPDWPIRYRNQWYSLGDPGFPIVAIGVFGQLLLVDPENELVMAKFSSQPDPESDAKDCMAIRASLAIGAHLNA